MANNSDATNAAIINSAGSINASILGNSGNRRAQERARQANLEFWRMQNEYNSPTAQMARLREAGLNPRYIYGSSGSQAVGNADKIAPAQAEDFRFENPIGDVSALTNTVARTNNLAYRNTVLTQEAALKAASVAKVGLDTKRGTLAYEMAQDLYSTSVDAQKTALKKLESDTISAQLDASFKSESMKNRLLDVYYRVQNAKSNLQGQEQLNELRRLEVNLNRIGIQKSDPWYFRIMGQIAPTSAIQQRASEIMNSWLKPLID